MARRMEIESKYSIPDMQTLQRLAALRELGAYRIVPRGAIDVVDRYFDTRDHDLLHGGFACRRRRIGSGGEVTVTVKGIGGVRGTIHEREEHEVRVAGDLPPQDWPPGPARDLVLRLAHGEPLVEILVLRQHRLQRDIRRNGRRVALLCLDRVEVQAANSSVSYELEIEVSPFGSSADLRQVDRLLEEYALAPAARSKFERALALVGAAPVAEVADAVQAELPRNTRAPAPGTAKKRGKRDIGIEARDPMHEAGRKILRFHYERMLAKEEGTRDGGDAEDLHDMRVATRRQRAALRIVEPFFRGKAVRPIRDGLRTTGRHLGAVRDLDVQLEAGRAWQAQQDAVGAAALAPLLGAWETRRAASRTTMLDYLDGSEWSTFKEAAERFFDSPDVASIPPPGGAPRATLVTHVVPEEIYRHYGALCAFEPVLAWAAVDVLHGMRIEAKRLRYVLEFFREVLGPTADDAIQPLVALQDHLGLLQDAVVTIGFVREFLGGPVAMVQPTAAVAAGRYLESRETAILELRRTLGRPWSRVGSADFKSSLARAVAAL
jgi:CHAD domain-containing protein